MSNFATFGSWRSRKTFYYVGEKDGVSHAPRRRLKWKIGHTIDIYKVMYKSESIVGTHSYDMRSARLFSILGANHSNTTTGIRDNKAPPGTTFPRFIDTYSRLVGRVAFGHISPTSLRLCAPSNRGEHVDKLRHQWLQTQLLEHQTIDTIGNSSHQNFLTYARVNAVPSLAHEMQRSQHKPMSLTIGYDSSNYICIRQ